MSTPAPGRLLALDYGLKRVGVAVTDVGQLIASPLDTVSAHGLLDFLRQYLSREPVAAFVVGMPRRLDSTPTDTTPHVVGLVKRLQRTFPDVPVHTVDERFTTVMATAAIRASGAKRKARQNKATVDKVSAAIILQSYLAQQTYR